MSEKQGSRVAGGSKVPGEFACSRRAALALAASVVAGCGAGLLGGCARSRERRPQAAGSGSSASPSSRAASDRTVGAPGGTAGRVVIDEQAWSFEGRAGRSIETPRFRILTTLGSGLLIERLPVFLEQALGQYDSLLTRLPDPPEKLTVYVMGDRPQWASLTQRLMGTEAELYLSIIRGGFAARGQGVYFDIGPRDTLAVAAHEGWHQYAQTTFAGPMPAWLDEGCATMFEGFRWDARDRLPVLLPWLNTERFDALRAIASSRRGVASLAEFIGQSPRGLIGQSNRQTVAWYAQAWSVVHFLREGRAGGLRVGFEAMVRDAASGAMAAQVRSVDRSADGPRAFRAGDAVLRAYVGEDAAALDTDYRAFVARITRPGARDLITRGHSPAT